MSPRAIGLVTLASLVSACGRTTGGGGAPAELPFLTLSEPALEIGVIEGPEAYVFGAIESAVRLGDRSIAVSDAGATRISVFAEDGTFLRSWGQRGEGPGEYAALSRVYPWAADSLLAAERWDGRLSLYDLEGTLARQLAGSDLSGDTTFVLDSWLYGRFWVEGALITADRAGVRAALDRLPPPRTGPGYRLVRVDRDGGLWVREPGGSGPVMWTRLGPDGAPAAVVAMPDAFRPTDILGHDMLGVWTGEADVQFVRAYHLVDTGETRPTPPWLLGSEMPGIAGPTPDEQAILESMRGSIRSMAMAQEVYYSTAMSYTTSIEALDELELPEEVVTDFVRGDARGWAAVLTHPAVDRACALAYGFDTPPGWMPGAILCGPESRPGADGAPAGGGAP